jgi:hypothetical protein
MSTLTAKPAEPVQACDVRFAGDRLLIELSDGRELSVPYKQVAWLKWLAKATPRQRAAWSVEPGGYAIYWEQLDDGIELCHLLATESLN